MREFTQEEGDNRKIFPLLSKVYFTGILTRITDKALHGAASSKSLESAFHHLQSELLLPFNTYFNSKIPIIGTKGYGDDGISGHVGYGMILAHDHRRYGCFQWRALLI